MLYKVTPAMTSPEPAAAPAAPKKEKKVRGPRKKRKSAVYDAEGNEVLISLTCLKCKTLKPLAQFGLRKMGDGAIRNQPWCRGCRAGAGTKGKKPETPLTVAPEIAAPAPTEAVAPATVAPATSAPAAAPVAPVAVAPKPVEVPAAAPVEEKAAPPVASAPQQDAPTSAWMAAIASLRAVVSRPSGGSNGSGSDES